MGSENNMVAVREALEPFAGVAVGDVWERFSAENPTLRISSSDGSRHLTFVSAEWFVRARDALARLASPQPDAQQGEGDQSRSDYCPGYCARGEPHNGPHDPVVLHRQAGGQTAEVLATPSSPALDAATIERFRRVLTPFANADIDVSGTAAIGVSGRDIIAARDLLYALPNAEKRHG